MTDPRAALRERQGTGARYDAVEAPAGALRRMRRGTAAVARLIDAMPDRALTGQVAETIAALGYHARACTRLLDGRSTWENEAQRAAEQALGATLPPRALRALFTHAARHLDVDLRDLPGAMWDRALSDGTPARALPDRHARRLWQASLTLGGRMEDIPPELREG